VRAATKRFRHRCWGVVAVCIPLAALALPAGAAAAGAGPLTSATQQARAAVLSSASSWTVLSPPDPSGDCEVCPVHRLPSAWLPGPMSQGLSRPASTPATHCLSFGTGASGPYLRARPVEVFQASRAARHSSVWLWGSRTSTMVARTWASSLSPKSGAAPGGPWWRALQRPRAPLPMKPSWAPYRAHRTTRVLLSVPTEKCIARGRKTLSSPGTARAGRSTKARALVARPGG
jgi:hypothetical protein